MQVSASLLIVASYLFKRWSGTPAARTAQAAELLRAIVPYLGHNSAHVRGSAAWGFFVHIEGLGREDFMATLPEEGAVLWEVHQFLAGNKECKKMRGRLRPVFLGMDPAQHSALACLTENSFVLPSLDGLDPTVHAVVVKHMFVDQEFQPSAKFLEMLKDEVSHEMEDLFDRTDPTVNPSCSDHWQADLQNVIAAASGTELFSDRSADKGDEPSTAAGAFSGLQRKFNPPAPPVPPGEKLAVTSATSRAPLIVVASLIDKTPNLAGLSRTSEVFGCQGICMANAKIVKDQTFQSISVTAEKWLPIHEVPRNKLRSRLLELRAQGYSLVGVEQTHDSVALDEWCFSEHTVLLLGAEKEGIDAELLPLLDGCVEIPQRGQVRSLNVHVSGSLAIWEYVRQQRASAR